MPAANSESIRMPDDIKLSEDQQRAIRAIWPGLKSGKKLQQSLGGFGGTGKSTIVSYMMRRMDNTAVCAFTGKAAAVLRKKGVDASTIHSLIYEPYFNNGVVEFELKSHLPLVDRIIVDEASMVSAELYRDLMSFGLPVLFVGDHGQLEPVGSDFNLMKNPDVKLEKIHRNAGDIAKFAEWLRFERSAKTFRGKGDKITLFDRSFVRSPAFVNMACETDQVICAYNKTRCEINARVRASMGRSGMLTIGEKVMCLKNNRKIGIFNGMQGTVADFYKEGRSHFIDFDADGHTYHKIRIMPDQFGKERTEEKIPDGMNPFDYAYAITCHKCVDPSTVVEVEGGLRTIAEIDQSGRIATPSGVFNYDNLVVNPNGPNITFITRDGYNITVTPDHRMECWDGNSYRMIEARDVSLGDTMRLKLGPTLEGSDLSLSALPGGDVRATRYETPKSIEGNLSEFLGLFVADGTLYSSGFRLAKRHPEVVARFQDLAMVLFGIKGKQTSIHGTPAVEFYSTLLSRWLEELGGLSPHQKDIPPCILRSTLDNHRRFLKGLFEDGFANLRDVNTLDHIGWTTKYPMLMNKVRTMLLRLGIIGGTLHDREHSHLYLYGRNAIQFREQIGFISESKQSRLFLAQDTQRYYTIPISKSELAGMKRHRGSKWNLFAYQNSMSQGRMSRNMAESLLLEKAPDSLGETIRERLRFHHSRVSRIDHGVGPSMCVTVPDDGRFLQNGFSHGNSQGDQFPKVLVVEQVCRNWEHKRWAYTAASRAMNSVCWICA